MKSFPFFLAFVLWLAPHAAHGQWQTTTYTLKGGWNAIYLTGDAKQGTLETLFPSEVEEVWRWNSRSTQVQFMSAPSSPSGGLAEWSVWKRGFPTESTFTQLTGQTTYLVRCSGPSTSSYVVALKQAPQPPRAVWVRQGANLMGFPTLKNGPNYPTFSNYFASFPSAIAAGTSVFKYTGGDLGPTNPIQLFSTLSERLDRTQAYWFSAEVVENFYGPLEINLSNTSGIDFGTSGSVITARIRNRNPSQVTINLSPVNSESAPSGQTSIAGPVPISRRTFNTTTLEWTETPITGAITQSIGGGQTVEVQFGVNRSALTGSANTLYASFLRLTDSTNLMEVYLPVRAQPTSPVGLWVGDANVSAVASKVAGSPGATTPATFPLRTLLHVPEAGPVRLLSQVFVGQLAVAPHDVGLCSRESLLKQDAKAGAQRLVAAHLPLDQVLTGVGGVIAPASFTCTVTIPFNDPTNPFVHQYHPDHDNKDARFQPVGAGEESYDISRSCTFTFTASPPAGITVNTGWGSSVIGGTYSETITGLHKEPITLSGTFQLQRASEIGTLSQ